MDRLILERTQPVQGQPVEVTVSWNGVHVGDMVFDFKAWLKFKKLLEKGLEMDAREDHALDLKLSVKGKEVIAKGEPYQGSKRQAEIVAAEAQNKKHLEDFAEDDEDAADLAAIAAAEAGSMPATVEPAENTDQVVQGVIRSLRRDNADG